MTTLSLGRVFQPSRTKHCFAFARLLYLLGVLLGAISPASAQTSSQQYVYASAPNAPSSSTSTVAGFTKVSQTGALNLLPSSPFNEPLEGGLMATDGQGKFVFVVNPTSDDISMFQIDQATGALSEVPGSPFAFPPIFSVWFPPCQPLSIAPERSGQFLFVGYRYANCGDFLAGGGQGSGAVVSFAIDLSGSSPVLTPVASMLTQGSPIKLLTDSKELHLYAGLGISNTGGQVSGTELFYIDGSGNLVDQGLTATTAINFGYGYAIDPQDRFIFELGGILPEYG